jgi:hypothetical protein
MKSLIGALAALLLAPAASAQPPEVSPDLVAYLDGIASEMGATRYGATLVGSLEEDEETTLVIAIPSDKESRLFIACDDFCEVVYAYAENSAGDTIDYSEDETHEALLTIPAGTGDRVSVTVTMGYCDNWDCEYAVQAFVR